jgi:SAM-dependent methyltransferase
MSPHDSLALRRPRTDERPLWDLYAAPFGEAAVLVAHDLKLFPLLAEHPRTPAEVCEALHIARRPAEALLTVAVATGLLHVHEGRYALTPLAEDYLLDSSATYFGGILDLIIGRSSAEGSPFTRVKQAVLSSAPPLVSRRDRTAFTRAMHSHSMGAALAWPDALDLSASRLMLDVGGGSGAHAIGAALRWPTLHALVLDLPPVCAVAEECIARHGLQDRIRTQEGDMWRTPFPAADLHFYAEIYHSYPPEQGRFLTQKSFESLPPGGRLVIHEMLFNDEKTGPFAVAGRTISMLLYTEGQQFSGRELAAMLTEAGFTDIEVRPTFGYWSIVTGRKP